MATGILLGMEHWLPSLVSIIEAEVPSALKNEKLSWWVSIILVW